VPDKPPTPRIAVAAAPAAVLLLCTVAYAVVVALAGAPLAVVPALLTATAVYGVLAWYRARRAVRDH
jgi:CHASE2 domain-containing sensor protein